MNILNTQCMAAGIAIFLLTTCLGFPAMAEVPNSVEFTVRIPDHSPTNTTVSLTVRRGDGALIVGPTMMTEVEEGLWRYTTRDLGTSWLANGDELEYMYSRHLWGKSGAEELVPDQFFGRTVRPSSDGLVKVFDEVVNWRWLPLPGFEMPEVQSAANETVFKPRIDGREFQSGHSLVDFWWDFWTPLLPSTHRAMKDSNANWIRIAPVSDYVQLSPTPVITQVQRANTREPGELEAHIRQAKADGLKVLLTPLVCCDFSPKEITDVPKTDEWWSSWLQQFESYVMYYVDIAARLEVDAIALRGDQPLLGLEQPSDFRDKLTDIYSRAQSQFAGLWGRSFYVGWQRGEFPSRIYPDPEYAVFLEEADFIALRLWAGPATSADAPQSELNANLMDWEQTVMRPIFDKYAKPVVLDEVAFPTVDGGLLGELSVNDPDAKLWNLNTDKYQLDLVEQAMGYEAVMNMVAQVDYFIGMYPFQYWPDEFPLGEGYDVRGKPAEVVLSGWYSNANAQNPLESPPVVHLSLEEPVVGSIHSGVGNLRGWAAAEAGIDKVEIWIDDVYAFDAPYGGSRGDVGNAFPDISDSSESGFSMAYAYSNLAAGEHTAKAIAYDAEGSVGESSVSFSVVKFEKSFIADPNAVDLSNASCSVSGDEVSVVDAVVSGDPLDMLLKWRRAEQGFEIIEIHGSGAGAAMLQQRQAMPVTDAVVNAEGSGSTLRVTLEEPVNAEIHSGVGNLRGWAVASQGIEKIEIYIDGDYAFDAPYGGARGDVGSLFPDVPGSTESGFSLAFTYSNLTAGTHTIEAVARTADGVEERSAATFDVVKFAQNFISDPQAVNLDAASCATEGDEISISGAMVAGEAYDMILDWRTAEQGFEIVDIQRLN